MPSDKSPEVLSEGLARLLNSRYELGEKVGEGSFFTVYRGRDSHSGRTVAVKILNEDFAGDREFAAQLALHTQLGLGREQERETHVLLARLFEEGQRRGEIRSDVPAGQLAELFTAAVLVTISNWLMAPAGEDPLDDTDEDQLDERLLRAWQVVRDGTATRPRPGRSRSAPSRPRKTRTG
jgi:serine/threonine protein kinase